VGLNSLKSLNSTNVYPNNKNKINNKVKRKPLELYDFAGKKYTKLFDRTSVMLQFNQQMEKTTDHQLKSPPIEFLTNKGNIV
jgi:hypothetical protein